MTNKPDWEQKIDELLDRGFTSSPAFRDGSKIIFQRTIREIIELSDQIEQEAEHTEFEEWKAFKRFRNTLRDKYL